eukprot:CAMPEP_0197868552 /NCGR_PEP_ID=MMETSP1438-20131217/45347_1 /TAXON_ID=1461541 /ORGANISM="Pterosperma sp., Strain CCMP1384" /LENGTH=220 /DNA_ID=CAMNT_0043487269 /DNA_START=422 /DNA_END=1081 /DNA_ORIENTATION=+
MRNDSEEVSVLVSPRIIKDWRNEGLVDHINKVRYTTEYNHNYNTPHSRWDPSYQLRKPEYPRGRSWYPPVPATYEMREEMQREQANTRQTRPQQRVVRQEDEDLESEPYSYSGQRPHTPKGVPSYHERVETHRHQNVGHGTPRHYHHYPHYQHHAAAKAKKYAHSKKYTAKAKRVDFNTPYQSTVQHPERREAAFSMNGRGYEQYHQQPRDGGWTEGEIF